MTHAAPEATCHLLTTAIVAYEAASLANSYPGAPMPHYITALVTDTIKGAVGSIEYMMDTVAEVRAWAEARNATAHDTYRPAAPGKRMFTGARVEFPHPFDARITVGVFCVNYADEATP